MPVSEPELEELSSRWRLLPPRSSALWRRPPRFFRFTRAFLPRSDEHADASPSKQARDTVPTQQKRRRAVMQQVPTPDETVREADLRIPAEQQQRQRRMAALQGGGGEGVAG